jgi:hypothetical protein
VSSKPIPLIGQPPVGLELNRGSGVQSDLRIEGEASNALHQVCPGGFNDQKALEIVTFYELVLALVFGDKERSTGLAMDHFKLGDKDYPVCISTYFPFYRCITSIDEIRRGKRIYWRYLRRDLAKLTTWWRKYGFENVQHLLLIVEAEIASIDKRRSVQETRKLYDKSVSTASRSGFTHHSALALELCAAFLKERVEVNFGRDYAEQSAGKYDLWGALAKADMLRREYNLEPSSEVSTHGNTGFRGR